MSYLRQLQSITQAINAKKGAVVAVTAENEDQIQQTRKASGYTGTIIVDPAHLLATKLRELGILDVALTAKAGYEHDMAQPAILVMDGKQKKVLYKWAIVPSLVSHCHESSSIRRTIYPSFVRHDSSLTSRNYR